MKKSYDERTPLIDNSDKMNGGYVGFHNDDDDDEEVKSDKRWSCRKLCLLIRTWNFWLHVLMCMFPPWLIYHYWEEIVTSIWEFFLSSSYGSLPPEALMPEYGPKVKRLQNLGHTCYFNSMVQSLNQTTLLHDMLKDTEPHKYIISVTDQDEPMVIEFSPALIDLTKELYDLLCCEIPNTKWTVVAPSGLLRELSNRNDRFKPGTEQDSHEALRCLLDGLRMEEIDRIKQLICKNFGVTQDPVSQSKLDGEDKLKLKKCLRQAVKQCLPVDKVFGGLQVSTTICRECCTPLQNEEKFFDLPLSLPDIQPPQTLGVLLTGSYQSPPIKCHVQPATQSRQEVTSVAHAKNVADQRSQAVKAAVKKSDEACAIDVDNDDAFTANDDQDLAPLITTVSDGDTKPDYEDMPNVVVQNFDEDVTADQNDTPLVTDNDQPSLLAGSLSQEVTQSDQLAGVGDVNGNETDPKTLPFKVENDAAFCDVDVSSSVHNYDPDVALNKAKMLCFLESKSLPSQVPDQDEESDPQNLVSILREYTALDVLDDDNKFICQTCTKNAETSSLASDDDDVKLCLVSKQIALHRLPPVLILQLKRFIIEDDGVHKDNQHIKFPQQLNMAPYCTTQCVEEMGDCNKQIWYGLYAVVIHHGKTIEHGHYYTYVKRRRPSANVEIPPGEIWEYDQAAATSGAWWFYTSDCTIIRCNGGFREVKKEKAYMLFYELLPKIPKIPTSMI